MIDIYFICRKRRFDGCQLEPIIAAQTRKLRNNLRSKKKKTKQSKRVSFKAQRKGILEMSLSVNSKTSNEIKCTRCGVTKTIDFPKKTSSHSTPAGASSQISDLLSPVTSNVNSSSFDKEGFSFVYEDPEFCREKEENRKNSENYDMNIKEFNPANSIFQKKENMNFLYCSLMSLVEQGAFFNEERNLASELENLDQNEEIPAGGMPVPLDDTSPLTENSNSSNDIGNDENDEDEKIASFSMKPLRKSKNLKNADNEQMTSQSLSKKGSKGKKLSNLKTKAKGWKDTKELKEQHVKEVIKHFLSQKKKQKFFKRLLMEEQKKLNGSFVFFF